jgi:hypothetical protein
MGRQSRHRARTASSQLIAKLAAALAAGLVILLAVPGNSLAAPQPCGGRAQITDAVGDGHHIETDVASAWFSQSAGRLQGVIRIVQATWLPAHEDSTYAGYALLFTVGGQTWYVRGQAPQPGAGAIQYDYGTWSQAGGFVSTGLTTGEVVPGSNGTLTLDIPAQTGAVSGAVLANPFVLTYDGVGPTGPHWVDRAPGGAGDQAPAFGTFGADYVVGPCVVGGGGPGGGGSGVLAVELRSPAKRTGRGKVRIRGNVAPAAGGVTVELALDATKDSTRRLTTGPDGTFSTSVVIKETTRLRATAGGLRSQTLTVTMRSKTRIAIKRLRKGRVLVKGKVDPGLPGRVLLLRANAIKPIARTKTRKGRFSFRFKRLRRGSYQAVFVPFKGRAERSTSNKGVIR